MDIKILFIEKSQLNDTPVINGQLICCENLENYFDIQTSRVQLGNCIQKSNLSELHKTFKPSPTTIYVVKDQVKAYMYAQGMWINVTTMEQIVGLIHASNTLTPTTLTKDNVRVAPRTHSNLVYLPDGRTLTQYLRDIYNEDPKLKIYTSTKIVLVNYDGQQVFDIPFPMSDYDLDKFPMVLITKDGVVDRKQYTYSRTQVLFKDTFPKFKRDEQITFIFHYTKRLDDGTINATSINGSVVFFSTTPPENPIENTVWVDTALGRMKKFINGKWEVFFNSTDNIKASVKSLKNSITINTLATEVAIGIKDFDPKIDTLMVYQNSTYLENLLDYIVTDDGTKIQATRTAWNGTDEPLKFNFIVLKGKPIGNKLEDPDSPYNDGVSRAEFKTIQSTVGENKNNIADIKLAIDQINKTLESIVQRLK